MENKDIAKQIIDYHKAAFETGFKSVLMLQEQTTKALDNILQQSPWMPAQTKSFINEWTNIYKKVSTDFKEAVKQNYAKLEEFLTASLVSFQSTSKSKN